MRACGKYFRGTNGFRIGCAFDVDACAAEFDVDGAALRRGRRVRRFEDLGDAHRQTWRRGQRRVGLRDTACASETLDSR
jgi:hypothetical protein